MGLWRARVWEAEVLGCRGFEVGERSFAERIGDLDYGMEGFLLFWIDGTGDSLTVRISHVSMVRCFAAD